MSNSEKSSTFAQKNNDKNVVAQQPTVEKPATFENLIDRIFSGQTDGLQQQFFDVSETPEFMKKLGITGDKFTLSYGTISRHIKKDSQHTLTKEIWKQLPEAIKTPFAITSYKDGKTDGYRLYTTIQTNEGYVVVGVNVKTVDKNIEVNSISTVFEKEGGRTKNEPEVLYESETITPQQQLLLAKPNPLPYPANEGLSGDKGTTNNLNNQTANTERQGKRILIC